MAYYRNLLLDKYHQETCFYCGKIHKNGNIVVDHFVPWSYMKEDNVWNLVLSCKKCNMHKSNKLVLKKRIKDIEKRNALLLALNDNEINREMRTYKKDEMKTIWQCAKDAGYYESY